MVIALSLAALVSLPLLGPGKLLVSRWRRHYRVAVAVRPVGLIKG
jgi:hypothetical protein